MTQEEEPQVEHIQPQMSAPETTLNINAQEFRPNKKKPKMLFKVTRHPENREMKDVNCFMEVNSALFSNETASTCVDTQSQNMSHLNLTVRNSSKFGSPFDIEIDDAFMQIDFAKKQHSNETVKSKLE